jgi:putative endonuclease
LAEAYTYLLECADGTLYVGWTTDLTRRVAAHSNGSGSRYTRGRRPVRLVFWEEHADRTLARRREQVLRRMSRTQKLRLVASTRRREGP